MTHDAGAGDRRRDGAADRPARQGGRAGWQKLVNDGGLTLFPDWSSPTMLQTIGQTFQELLAGKASEGDVVTRIQKDWADYDSDAQEWAAS